MRLSFTSSFRAAAITVAVLSATACGGMSGGGASPATAPEPTVPWPVIAREHVDLWLHGYAMISRDVAQVPLFSRGYRERMAAYKTQRNLYTQLDANTDQLATRLAQNPALVNGQFVPLYFASFEELRDVSRQFIQADGNAQAANNATTQLLFAVLNGSFPTANDREWLRVFVNSLDDERNRYYHGWWTAEQQTRAATKAATDSMWQKTYRAKFEGYLNHVQMTTGDFLLSLTLGGEGRTVTLGGRRNAVTVGFPAAGAPEEAFYVFAHEVVASVASTAVTDNTTAAEQREGAVDRYVPIATVRAGAMLLARIAPELAPGYMRYYLRVSGATAPSGDPTAAFVARFALTDVIRDALTRQLDSVLGGI